MAHFIFTMPLRKVADVRLVSYIIQARTSYIALDIHPILYGPHKNIIHIY